MSISDLLEEMRNGFGRLNMQLGRHVRVTASEGGKSSTWCVGNVSPLIRDDDGLIAQATVSGWPNLHNEISNPWR